MDCVTKADILRLCKANAIYWTDHVGKRLIKRKISPDEVISVLLRGTIIEHYPTDYPFPSCLMFSMVGMRPLHVVCSIGNEQLFIITAYEPDPDSWDAGFMRRRQRGGLS